MHIDSDSQIAQVLSRVQHQVSRGREYASTLREWNELFSDGAAELRQVVSNVDGDPERAVWAAERLMESLAAFIVLRGAEQPNFQDDAPELTDHVGAAYDALKRLSRGEGRASLEVQYDSGMGSEHADISIWHSRAGQSFSEKGLSKSELVATVKELFPRGL